MHIPETMLNGTVCQATLAVSGLGLTAAVLAASRQKDNRPDPARFAAVTSLIFALQMLNFPVYQGISGHLMGGMLAVTLLGIPFSIISMAIVLFIQAFFFGDGGINALGANILNMGLIGTGFAGFCLLKFKDLKLNQYLALGLISWFSVICAAFACSLEVAVSGSTEFTKVLPAMLSVHTLIGIGEVAITLSLIKLIDWSQKKKPQLSIALPPLGFVAIALFFIPFASQSPDGLEWVAHQLSFTEFSAINFVSPFPDYEVFFQSGSALASVAAGTLGSVLIFLMSYAMGFQLNKDVH